MSKITMLGKLMEQVQKRRKEVTERAQEELWKRNDLVLHSKRNQYHLDEKKTVLPSGEELFEYRLYKLIDTSVVRIKAEVKSKVDIGIEAVPEGKVRGN